MLFEAICLQGIKGSSSGITFIAVERQNTVIHPYSPLLIALSISSKIQCMIQLMSGTKFDNLATQVFSGHPTPVFNFCFYLKKDEGVFKHRGNDLSCLLIWRSKASESKATYFVRQISIHNSLIDLKL